MLLNVTRTLKWHDIVTFYVYFKEDANIILPRYKVHLNKFHELSKVK